MSNQSFGRPVNVPTSSIYARC